MSRRQFSKEFKLRVAQELVTAVRMATPFVSLIFNDSGYGLISWKQQMQFNREAFVGFKNPDFVQYANSLGGKGYRVGGPDELVPIFREAFQQNVPTVIDCPVDYSENVKLTRRLEALVCPDA